MLDIHCSLHKLEYTAACVNRQGNNKFQFLPLPPCLSRGFPWRRQVLDISRQGHWARAFTTLSQDRTRDRNAIGQLKEKLVEQQSEQRYDGKGGIASPEFAPALRPTARNHWLDAINPQKRAESTTSIWLSCGGFDRYIIWGCVIFSYWSSLRDWHRQ